MEQQAVGTARGLDRDAHHWALGSTLADYGVEVVVDAILEPVEQLHHRVVRAAGERKEERSQNRPAEEHNSYCSMLTFITQAIILTYSNNSEHSHDIIMPCTCYMLHT